MSDIATNPRGKVKYVIGRSLTLSNATDWETCDRQNAGRGAALVWLPTQTTLIFRWKRDPMFST